MNRRLRRIVLLHAFHLVAWGFNPLKCVPQVAMFLCFWIGHANSAINPLMYMYLDTKFRVAFLEIIGRTFSMWLDQ